MGNLSKNFSAHEFACPHCGLSNPNPRLIDALQEYRDLIFTGYAETPSMDFPGAEYGYGWFIGETLNRRVIFQGGAMSGYTAGMMRFPDEGVTIIVLRNYEILVYDRLEIEIAKLLFGES